MARIVPPNLEPQFIRVSCIEPVEPIGYNVLSTQLKRYQLEPKPPSDAYSVFWFDSYFIFLDVCLISFSFYLVKFASFTVPFGTVYPDHKTCHAVAVLSSDSA